jgi:hypothetical protein
MLSLWWADIIPKLHGCDKRGKLDWFQPILSHTPPFLEHPQQGRAGTNEAGSSSPGGEGLPQGVPYATPLVSVFLGFLGL